MTEQVTSIKNEGRVAAGKRLVEWNRKNKNNLLKNKDQEPTSAESSDLSSSQQEPTSHAALCSLSEAARRYGGGTFFIFAVGIAIYFYFQQKKPGQEKPDAKNYDAIRMN